MKYFIGSLAPLSLMLVTGCVTQQEARFNFARERAIDTALIGSWTVKSTDLGGQPFSMPPGMELKINGAEYGIRDLNKSSSYVDTGKLVFFGDELAGEPRRLDVLGKEGPNKGKRIPAIYRVSLSGRELEICYDLDEKERPTDFVSRAGTQWLRVSYVRKPL